MFSVNKVIGEGIKHECIVHVLVILQQMSFISYILLLWAFITLLCAICIGTKLQNLGFM